LRFHHLIAVMGVSQRLSDHVLADAMAGQQIDKLTAADQCQRFPAANFCALGPRSAAVTKIPFVAPS
jgi:hypothetical protein